MQSIQWDPSNAGAGADALCGDAAVVTLAGSLADDVETPGDPIFYNSIRGSDDRLDSNPKEVEFRLSEPFTAWLLAGGQCPAAEPSDRAAEEGGHSPAAAATRRLPRRSCRSVCAQYRRGRAGRPGGLAEEDSEDEEDNDEEDAEEEAGRALRSSQHAAPQASVASDEDVAQVVSSLFSAEFVLWDGTSPTRFVDSSHCAQRSTLYTAPSLTFKPGCLSATGLLRGLLERKCPLTTSHGQAKFRAAFVVQVPAGFAASMAAAGAPQGDRVVCLFSEAFSCLAKQGKRSTQRKPIIRAPFEAAGGHREAVLKALQAAQSSVAACLPGSCHNLSQALDTPLAFTSSPIGLPGAVTCDNQVEDDDDEEEQQQDGCHAKRAASAASTASPSPVDAAAAGCCSSSSTATPSLSGRRLSQDGGDCMGVLLDGDGVVAMSAANAVVLPGCAPPAAAAAAAAAAKCPGALVSLPAHVYATLPCGPVSVPSTAGAARPAGVAAGVAAVTGAVRCSLPEGYSGSVLHGSVGELAPSTGVGGVLDDEEEELAWEGEVGGGLASPVLDLWSLPRSRRHKSPRQRHFGIATGNLVLQSELAGPDGVDGGWSAFAGAPAPSPSPLPFHHHHDNGNFHPDADLLPLGGWGD